MNPPEENHTCCFRGDLGTPHNCAKVQELTYQDIDEILTRAILKSETMTPDNFAPLMTHDIEVERCTGLTTCPIHYERN